jgi:hypothetical protein
MRYSSQIDGILSPRPARGLGPSALGVQDFAGRWAAPTSGDPGVAPTGQDRRKSEPSALAGDAKLAVVFRQIRAISGLNEAEMARRIGSGIDVVLSFEAGNVDALPPWPETARLIERYAALGGVDPAPLLSRILSLQTLPVVPPPLVRQAERQTDPVQMLSDALRRAPGPEMGPSAFKAAVQDLPAAALQTARIATPDAAAPAAASPIGFAARSRLQEEPATERPRTAPLRPAETAVLTASTTARRRRRMRNTALVLSPLLLVIALFIGLQVAPRPVYALAHKLPSPVGPATRSVIDVFAAQTATFRDGLRWIELDDPRLRKAQRLNTR